MKANVRATGLVVGIGVAAATAGITAAVASLCDPIAMTTDATMYSPFACNVWPYRSLFLFAAVGLLLLGFGITYLPGNHSSGVRDALIVGVSARTILWIGAAIYVGALVVPAVR